MFALTEHFGTKDRTRDCLGDIFWIAVNTWAFSLCTASDTLSGEDGTELKSGGMVCESDYSALFLAP